MIPVYQTIFGAGGNCFQAAVASILEMPLRDVPHFYEHKDWYLTLIEFLKRFDRDATYMHLPQPGLPPERIPVGFHIMSGYAARGYHHAVVGYQGNFVHDPHPQGRGLILTSHWMVIHPRKIKDWTDFSIPYEVKK